MYIKLATRNIVRSAKSYLIYFITIILTVALMYSFSALGFSDDIISLSENMAMLTTAIVILSVLVAVFSSFVISYAVRFMLGQRKKEFATYELLGMEVKTIQKLFLLENISIGVIAFLIGVVIGITLSGLFTQIVINIFKVTHSYQVTFSVSAFLLVLLLFILMYGVGMLRAARIIHHTKIIDLLSDNRKNEETVNKGISRNIVSVLMSFLFLVISAICIWQSISIQTNSAILFIGAAICIFALGIYGAYRNLPYILLTLSKKKVSLKYSNVNLFYLGQITRRIHSCGRMMAVTAILFAVSLATMFVGLMMGNGYRANIEVEYPYDVAVALDVPLAKGSLTPLVSFVNEKCPVTDSRTFYLYTVDGYPITALSYSDYSYLRAMLGLAPVSLNEDQYLVHCDTWNYQQEIKNHLLEQSTIVLADCSLDNPEARIYTEPMEQYQMAGVGGYVIVVPDAVANLLQTNRTRIVMSLDGDGDPELRSEIRRFLNGDDWQPEMLSDMPVPDKMTLGVTVKAWGVANSLTGFTTIAFCGLYLSIVFILLSCTVLAFEQLSALDINKRNYEIIDKLGVSKDTQGHLIHRELSTFFLIPLVLPMLVTLLLVVSAQSVFARFILQENIIPFCGAVTLGVFGFIFLVYYFATYYLFKKAVASR